MTYTTPTADLLDALEAEGWKYERHPQTGEILYHANGDPRVVPVALEEKIAPVARRWHVYMLRVASIALLAGVLFIGYVALRMYLPESAGAIVELVFTFLVRWAVFAGLGCAVLIAIPLAIWRLAKGAFGR